MSYCRKCDLRIETDGCTEWSCMYHGEINRTKHKEHEENCTFKPMSGSQPGDKNYDI